MSSSLNGEEVYLKKSKDKCLICDGPFEGAEWFIEKPNGRVIGAFCSGKCSAKYRENEKVIGGN